MENLSENKVGVNPIPDRSWHADMVKRGYTLGFVYSNMGVTWEYEDGTKLTGFNFNPYITDKDGNKQYYQRELCWSLEDKQSFIESIYNDMNCGIIVLKVNSDEKAKEVGADWDVVDGKQRLNTLIEFFNNKFPDMHGNYWKDFSVVAKRRFRNSLNPITFYEFRENVSDADIKRAFLNVNFTGKPMSKEHIEFVNSIKI